MPPKARTGFCLLMIIRIVQRELAQTIPHIFLELAKLTSPTVCLGYSLCQLFVDQCSLRLQGPWKSTFNGLEPSKCCLWQNDSDPQCHQSHLRIFVFILHHLDLLTPGRNTMHNFEPMRNLPPRALLNFKVRMNVLLPILTLENYLECFWISAFKSSCSVSSQARG